ncbi:hypothetical protein NDU88_002625 [Pleurodeles waltl]|uniref:Uncharacterized protein n=1 Tax=Pleurodeles waltl TaxID=8319 RepID=A0AAV7UW64_PLEWA|nr:hypothetical protein NDU88_002625 [Pleurodeles waltl]
MRHRLDPKKAAAVTGERRGAEEEPAGNLGLPEETRPSGEALHLAREDLSACAVTRPDQPAATGGLGGGERLGERTG